MPQNDPHIQQKKLASVIISLETNPEQHAKTHFTKAPKISDLVNLMHPGVCQ